MVVGRPSCFQFQNGSDLDDYAQPFVSVRDPTDLLDVVSNDLLSRLPGELKLVLFKYLDFKSILSVAGTNGALRRFIHSNTQRLSR